MKMIEKVARALCRDKINCNIELDKALGKTVNVNVQIAEDNVWQFYQRQAKAAIEAMREPTEEMIAVGGGQNEYEAMIDAALKEE